MNTLPSKAELKGKGMPELVEIFNSLVKPEKRVKKFSDKKVGIERITRLLEQDSAGLEVHSPASPDQKKALSKQLSERSKSKPVVADEKGKGGKTIGLNLTVTQGVGEGSDLIKGSRQARLERAIKLVGKKSIHAGKKIYMLEKENPRRAGTHGWHNWNRYKNGMTYEEFITAKGGANHLNFDLKKGYIELCNKS